MDGGEGCRTFDRDDVIDQEGDLSSVKVGVRWEVTTGDGGDDEVAVEGDEWML